MLSTKQAIETERIQPSLIRGVIRQTGRENLEDIARHGVDGGFAGFTYYSDTCAFWKHHRDSIAELIREMANDFGQDSVSLVAGFGCLDDDTETRESIGRCLYGGRTTDEDIQVQNALAWFAAEEVARLICDE